MSEIEKMYENANIKICKRKQGFTLKDCADRDCKECGYYDMPSFNAEKQIKLIKWLGKNKNGFGFLIIPQKGLSCHCEYNWEWFDKGFYAEEFDNALAGLINNLWQDLTEEEKQQVKGILE